MRIFQGRFTKILRHTDDLYPLCRDEVDTQQHLLVRPHLDGAEVALRAPDYDDLFREGVQPKIIISRIMHSDMLKEKYYLKKKKKMPKAQGVVVCSSCIFITKMEICYYY